MSDRARITFRFDHKSAASRSGEPSRQEADQQKEHKPQPETADKPKVVSIFQDEMQFTQEIAPWHSPFQDDPNALEKLIREADYSRSSEENGRESAMLRTVIEKKRTDKKINRLAEQNGHDEKRDRLDTERMIEIDLGDDKEYSSLETTNPASGGWYESLLAKGDSGASVYADGSAERMRRTPPGPSWFKVFASVAGAIATGALFGYMVLSLFAGETVWPGGGDAGKSLPSVTDSRPTVNQGEPVVTITEGTGSGNALPNMSNGSFIQVELPSFTYYMLQIGVFSSKEGMDTAAAELQQKGFAAAAAAAGDFRVYAGIAGDRMQAKSLEQQLSVPEVYVKAIETPSAEAVRFDGNAEQISAFIERTDGLIRLFNELTIRQLGQEKLSPIGSSSWKDSHQQWTTAVSAVQTGILATGKPEYEKLIRSMNTAAVSISEYEKNPSRTHLWTAQTALMEAVLAEKAWLEQIVAL